MWRFLRTLLAFTLAFLLAMFIGGLLLVGALTTAGGILASRSSDGLPAPQAGWLLLNLSGELKENEASEWPSFSWQRWLFGAPEEKTATLEEIRRALETAQKKSDIPGVVLRLGDLSARPAQVQQIGRWLLSYKQKTGKPIYAYGDYFTELTYYLASYADTVILYPGSGAAVEWNGLVAEGVFFRRFLEKWGVKPRLFRTGAYKSAAENFTETGYSADNRAQITALLEDVWSNWIDSIARRRDLSAESLRTWPDRYIFFSAQQAREKRLVDTLLPWQVWVRRFIPEGEEKPEFVSVQALSRSEKPSKKKAQVALLYAEGEIGPESELQAEKLVPLLRKALQDDKIKAVVLRVNSPGGAVLDSDKIARAVKELRTKKPVVVSMGGVAASGGYYISAFADKIVAEPTTITGSIGVIGLLFEVKGLLEKELALTTDRVRVGGQYADFLSPYREATPQETARLQSEIDGIYEEFLQVVKEGRRYPSRDAVHSIAQGRVWSGQDALSHGLVDTLGGLETALTLAARAAQLADYEVISLPEPESFFEKWIKKIQSTASSLLFGAMRTPLPAVFQARWIEFNLY
ncbi:MAG: signal peptide peptidase SppA [Bacteroidia bacterium]|nr:MAG: signal peptide peptidase SppA [Bacteroidia bacterium]